MNALTRVTLGNAVAKDIRTPNAPIDAEFTEIEAAPGRRGFNDRLLDADDIRRDYADRHGLNISLAESERIARLRQADEAAFQQEPLVFIVLGILIVASVIGAFTFGGINHETVLVACGVILVIGASFAGPILRHLLMKRP